MAVDAKIADAFSNDANTQFCAVDEIPDGWEGLDIGPKTEEIFANVIKESKTILWNGPTGVFEFDNFTDGSRAVGEAIVEAVFQTGQMDGMVTDYPSAITLNKLFIIRSWALSLRMTAISVLSSPKKAVSTNRNNL